MSKVADELMQLASEQTDERVQKALRWAAVELDDRADCIEELDADVIEYGNANIKLTNALHELQQKLRALTDSIRATLWTPEPPAVDLTPFKNVMAAHGVEPYEKNKRKKATE